MVIKTLTLTLTLTLFFHQSNVTLTVTAKPLPALRGSAVSPYYLSPAASRGPVILQWSIPSSGLVYWNVSRGDESEQTRDARE